jgi:hypothetical protein
MFKIYSAGGLRIGTGTVYVDPNPVFSEIFVSPILILSLRMQHFAEKIMLDSVCVLPHFNYQKL